jgi:hypothetical protein
MGESEHFVRRETPVGTDKEIAVINTRCFKTERLETEKETVYAVVHGAPTVFARWPFVVVSDFVMLFDDDRLPR